ncbi:hypothetical protein [Candidatus Poriferisodalis sp.]|uniref:hypothetical protein n=1 Tax=Candidatus Poriferisodalis sp. TaxID=3101277 RepID=UPI003B024638
MDPVIAHSARQHGVTDDQMLHVYRNPIHVHVLGELDMLIGGDQSGRLLEVGVMTDVELGIDVIVHAMLARRRFLEWRL